MLTASFAMQPKEQELYRQVLQDGPIRGRYLAIEQDAHVLRLGADELLARYTAAGRDLAVRAARQAMDRCGLAPGRVAALVTNSCTGYLCPGLSSYVAQDLHLPEPCKVLDLMGMGCGGAIPNLESACGMLARGLGGPVLSVAVEVCSATMFMGPDSGLVVSNSIFGDGAACAVLSGDGPGDASGPALVDFETGIFPQHRQELRYESRQGRLRNVLSRRVPVIAGRCVQQVVERLLERNGLKSQDIRWWIVHPGGTAVLEQIGRKLGLTEEALRHSYDIFREFGNMSSASVLFVLRHIMEQAAPRPGDRGVMVSFGAGFTCFASLLEF